MPYLGLVMIAALVAPTAGQDTAERDSVLAVVEAALDAISQEDMASVAELMLNEAVTVALTAPAAGQVSGERDSGLRTMTVADWRSMTVDNDFVERGFDAEVHIAGPLASVWLPYDFYIDGKLSHCGIDAFTLVLTDAGWRISGLAFTRSQPPDCRLHPDGPPAP